MQRWCFWLVCLLPALSAQSQETPLQKLDKLGLQLPPVSQPIANYVKWVKTGNLIFTSGHGPTRATGELITGKLGAGMTVEQGYEAARVTALQLIATLQAATGDLSKIKRIVKVLGLVNCTPEFADQPKVMNGCSDLLVAVFGDKGRHARSAVGTNALPNGMAVEIEMVVEVSD